MIKIYGDDSSGNCRKIKYVCDFLGIDYEWIDVDLLNKQTRSKEFLQMNPSGQVPLIQLEDDRFLTQSNAILRYLARNSELIPQDSYLAAQMDAWLFWEQYSHEPAIAVLRSKFRYQNIKPDEADPAHIEKCYWALGIMEEQLAKTAFLVGEQFTIADIALLAYTRLAPEAHLDLGRFPHIVRWIKNCEKNLRL